jgi:hypothetical protein
MYIFVISTGIDVRKICILNIRDMFDAFHVNAKAKSVFLANYWSVITSDSAVMVSAGSRVCLIK